MPKPSQVVNTVVLFTYVLVCLTLPNQDKMPLCWLCLCSCKTNEKERAANVETGAKCYFYSIYFKTEKWEDIYRNGAQDY